MHERSEGRAARWPHPRSAPAEPALTPSGLASDVTAASKYSSVVYSNPPRWRVRPTRWLWTARPSAPASPSAPRRGLAGHPLVVGGGADAVPISHAVVLVLGAEGDHLRSGRSSSAAKEGAAAFDISFGRRNSAFSRFSALTCLVLGGREPGPGPGVDLSAADPLARRLGRTDAQLGRDQADRPELRGILITLLQHPHRHQPHRPLTELSVVPRRSCLDLHPPHGSGLRTSREVSQRAKVQKEERARGEMMPTGRDDEAVEGSTDSDERSVGQWLERNLEDQERGPVSHVERVNDTDRGAAAAPGSRDPVKDNLIQLPIGAEFQLGHEPSPQEREDLVRQTLS
jgi:hypothetical protein